MSEIAVEAPEALEATEPIEPAEPAIEATPAEPASPDFSQILSSPEAQAAIDRATEARLAQMFQEEPEAPASGLEEFDFLADDAPQRLAQLLEEREQRLLSQFQAAPAVQHANQEYARQWADSQFSEIEGSLGAGVTIDSEARELAILAAAGSGGQDPAQSLSGTATRLHSYVEKRVQAGIEAYKQQMSAAAGGGPQEPGVSGGGVHADTYPEGYENWSSSKKLDYRFGRVEAAHTERL